MKTYEGDYYKAPMINHNLAGIRYSCLFKGIELYLIKSRKLMFKSNELKESSEIVSIHSSDILEQKIPKIIEELVDLVGKYKAKRNLWEVKLKTRSYDDPRKPDLYAIIARLATLDMMVVDLERLMSLLTDITKFIP